MVPLMGHSTPDVILDWCHENGARTVVLKLGAEGCVVSDGQSRTFCAGHPVAPVDATGAGDCFCGNFLARMAANDSVVAAASYANAAASLAVQGFGAVAPLPYPDAVWAAMARSHCRG